MPQDLPGKRTIKRFRVAREGQTVDGRTLSQQEIIDMAETYDPVEYTARINCEHMSGSWAGISDDNRAALGDVIAVDAKLETFVINKSEVQLMCLYATLSVLPNLVEANKAGKKIFTSIEFYRKFADTGRAYLVGLAVTDTPASRGTEPLKFTKNEGALCTDPTEQELVLMTVDSQTPATQQTNTQQTDTPVAQIPATNNGVVTQTAIDKDADGNSAENSFLTKLSTMFAGKKTGMSKQEQDLILESFERVNAKAEEAIANHSALEAKYTALEAKFELLNTQLAEQPATNLTAVPPATGGGAELTTF